jgi:hypothetical protein
VKTTIRIIYEHSISTQETFNAEQLQWAISEIIKLMASGSLPRITGFSVQHGEDRREYFSHPENIKKGRE